MDIFLYNSAHREKELFSPIQEGRVGMYTCGMTVYDYAHIGHGRKYVGDDIVRRLFENQGYVVQHVQNVTDVGHLVSDEDEGEDKMEKGAIKHGKTVWEVAQFFTDHFYTSMDALGVLRPTVICKATDHIPEQIALIETLIEKGFAYDTPEAVYFDIGKFPAYGSLFGGQNLEDKKTAVREEVQTGSHKKNPADFALWFKRVGHFAQHTMHWMSPWGDGFPGWHIECSAMSMKYLGETFDIHTGGIDHIPVHHPNEIAQSEAATGAPFVHYWMHHAFLTVDGKKMSKSLGNYYTIEQVIEKGYDPLALRFLYLSAHYRQQLNFTWEALEGAREGLLRLRTLVAKVLDTAVAGPGERDEEVVASQTEFFSALCDDVNTPRAVGLLFSFLKEAAKNTSQYGSDALRAYIAACDAVLGVGLMMGHTPAPSDDIPEEIRALMVERDAARASKEWLEADRLRAHIESQGYTVEDTATGTLVKKL